MHDDLEAIVARVGHLARRLVVLDLDGTLAPIADDPEAGALPGAARAAVTRFLDRGGAVAIISGRRIEDLAARVDGLPVPLVGEHGATAQLPNGEVLSLVPADAITSVLRDACDDLRSLLGHLDGWILEEKHHSLSVHFGRAAPEAVRQTLPAVLTMLEGFVIRPPGWRVLDGERAVELRPRDANPGTAIRWLTAHHPGRVPIVFGDSLTDEEAFVAARDLGGDGVLVHDRPRPTAARWRLDDPERVVRALGDLDPARSVRRGDADRGREHPIEEYGLITDSRTSALVSPDASIDWLCLPRFDSPTAFAALLDPVRGGRFRVRPERHDAFDVQRTYLGESNVLVTRFVSDGDPVLTVTDFLVHSRVNAFDPTHTGHLLIRRVESFRDVVAEVEFQPRFDYGRAHTEIRATPRGLRADAGTEHLTLEAQDVRWDVADHADGNGGVGRAVLDLGAGEERWFVLRTSGAERSPHAHLQPQELLDLTLRTWGRWTRLVDYDGPWREQVVRSALLLKGLVYEPTGALVAAPTTSLPETLGGERNWDYRYAWIRDSAYVLECFLRIGHSREAETFIRWLSELTDRVGGAHELRPLYRVTGEEDLTEFELDHLTGYRGSSPVRVGNAASNQLQLDIYGAVMQLGYLTVQLGGEVPAAQWPVILELVETVERRWPEPDSGLWEIRSAPRHHTFSKFQCWIAVDRAIRIGRDLGLPAAYERWDALCSEIADDIMTHGYNEEIGTFTQAYGSDAVDASVLLLPLRGFIPPRHHRVRCTVRAVREQLEVADGLLLRYRTEDGLRGDEGAFLMCSFWLVELLARIGDIEEAERLFERLLGLAGPLGLFAEEVDPVSHHHLGNYPQAFTHMGLIAAATALADETSGRARLQDR